MSDYQSRLNYCTRHGAFLSKVCPRCDPQAYIRCADCKSSYHIHHENCPICEEKGSYDMKRDAIVILCQHLNTDSTASGSGNSTSHG